MEFKITSGHLKNARVKGVISFLFKEQKKFPEEILELDEVLDGAISQIKKELKFDGSEGKFMVVPTFGKGKTDFVIIFGAGSKRNFDLDKARRLGALSVKKAKELKIDRFLLDGEALSVKDSQEEIAQALTEGVILGNYRFDKYLSKKDEFRIKEVQIRVSRRYKEVC
ncbi:MAG: M17 family peptidase N-terminal domain-containing protein [Persephonella sp.]|nr:M17 family peptidase N-terminal domain-containing protein [Persephonella sp.]